MKDLLEKLSSHNIFNYLFPGILVAVLSTAVSSFDLLVDDIVVGVFLYYFYGLVVSRIGSLVLEPILKRIRVVRFAPYADFVAASRIDEKIDMFSEQNNLYRTLASTFLCLTLLGSRIGPSQDSQRSRPIVFRSLFFCSWLSSSGRTESRRIMCQHGLRPLCGPNILARQPIRGLSDESDYPRCRAWRMRSSGTPERECDAMGLWAQGGLSAF